jgi:hypothetical protein
LSLARNRRVRQTFDPQQLQALTFSDRDEELASVAVLRTTSSERKPIVPARRKPVRPNRKTTDELWLSPKWSLKSQPDRA